MTERNEKRREPSKPDSKRSGPDFDSEPLPDKIGTSLRQLYAEVLVEDVPDEFLNLLRKADGGKTARPSDGASK